MKKHWILTAIFLAIIFYYLKEKTIETQIYSAITRDCSVYKNSDRQQFMSCWRAKRNASYSLKKRLGKNEEYMVGKVK